MLAMRTLFASEEFVITDVACRHALETGCEDEHVGRHAIVLVRRGLFAYHGQAAPVIVDPTLAFAVRPGDAHRYDHPLPGGDDCTSLSVSPALLDEIWGDRELPIEPLPVSGAANLEHRLLLTEARGAADRHALLERGLSILAEVLDGVDAQCRRRRRPSTAVAHRRLVDGVREPLAADLDVPLPRLAAALSVSPHHLSRVFRTDTGITIAGYGLQLRTRSAIERLSCGGTELAALAAELGFTDQSHLTRAVRRETARTPAVLRAMLIRPSSGR